MTKEISCNGNLGQNAVTILRQDKINANETILHGYFNQQLEVGNILRLGIIQKTDYNFEVSEIMERRDAAGVWNNKEMAKGLYFKVRTTNKHKFIG